MDALLAERSHNVSATAFEEKSGTAPLFTWQVSLGGLLTGCNMNQGFSLASLEVQETVVVP